MLGNTCLNWNLYRYYILLILFYCFWVNLGTNEEYFRFGHSESLVPLLSILGLYKDTEDLRADNFANKKDRKFRASLISPFAANLAFILHKCDSHEDRGDSLESFQLQLLVNEKPTKFPFCDTDLCPYSVVRQQYSHYINDCDLASMCRLPESNKDEL